MFKRFNTETPSVKTPVQQSPSSTVQRRSRSQETVELTREEKRKLRMIELRKIMHRRLLENLNLGAIETATDTDLKREIAAITADGLQEQGTVLSKDDRATLNQELFDEVTGLGPLETLLKDDTISDILINGCKNIFIERAGILEKSLLNSVTKTIYAVLLIKLCPQLDVASMKVRLMLMPV